MKPAKLNRRRIEFEEEGSNRGGKFEEVGSYRGNSKSKSEDRIEEGSSKLKEGGSNRGGKLEVERSKLSRNVKFRTAKGNSRKKKTGGAQKREEKLLEVADFCAEHIERKEECRLGKDNFL
jgi:hypothetical protein